MYMCSRVRTLNWLLFGLFMVMVISVIVIPVKYVPRDASRMTQSVQLDFGICF